MKNEKSMIKKILGELEKKYRDKHGAAIFNIGLKERKDGIEILGEVLIKNQKSDIINAIKEAGIRICYDRLKIISDPVENMEIGWGKIDDSIVDVLGKYIPLENLTARAKNKIRATQLKKGDIVKILAEKDSQLLIQSEDLTLGWVNKLKVKNEKLKIKVKNLKKRWMNAPRMQKDKLVSVKKIKNSEINRFIKKILGAPYSPGGAAEKGIDCSALAQKMYKELYGIILPRHSEDQAKCGVAVKKIENARINDLVFLKLKENGHFHIGIIIDISNAESKSTDCKLQTIDYSEDIWILNARRHNGGVVIQDLREMLKDYKLIDIRRIIR